MTFSRLFLWLDTLIKWTLDSTHTTYILEMKKKKSNRETISTVSRLMELYGHVPGECGASSLSLEAKSFHHCLPGTFLCPVNVIATFFLWKLCCQKVPPY